MKRRAIANEKEKLKLEQERLKLEHEKLSVEHKKSKWNSVAISFPVIIAVLTIGFSLWSAHQQARREFQLTVVQSALEESGHGAALNRLRFFADLFPGQIAANMAIEADKYGRLGNPTAASKKFLFEQMRESGLSSQQLLSLWRALFSDEWARNPELDKVIDAATPATVPTTQGPPN